MSDSIINIILIIAAIIISISFVIGAVKTLKRIDGQSPQKPKQIKSNKAHHQPA